MESFNIAFLNALRIDSLTYLKNPPKTHMAKHIEETPMYIYPLETNLVTTSKYHFHSLKLYQCRLMQRFRLFIFCGTTKKKRKLKIHFYFRLISWFICTRFSLKSNFIKLQVFYRNRDSFYMYATLVSYTPS